MYFYLFFDSAIWNSAVWHSAKWDWTAVSQKHRCGSKHRSFRDLFTQISNIPFANSQQAWQCQMYNRRPHLAFEPFLTANMPILEAGVDGTDGGLTEVTTDHARTGW